MSEYTHIFSVRGRPVGFVPGRFGGALVAIERGYFPVSGTGYRSLAGHFGISGEADHTAISPAFLEALAVAQDCTQDALLARLRRRPIATDDRLGNFISVSIDAEAALAEGFFAPDERRFVLWRGAFHLLDLIDGDVRFQPTPTAPAWDAGACARSLTARRVLREFVRHLAEGEIAAPPEGTHCVPLRYLELPIRTEPRFALPAVTRSLPLDLPPPEFEPEDVEENEPISAAADYDDAAQLSLF